MLVVLRDCGPRPSAFWGGRLARAISDRCEPQTLLMDAQL